MIKNLLVLISPTILLAKDLVVDEIITNKNNIRTALSISYANINRKNDKIIPISYQTSNGDFVSVPTYVGSSNTNQDFISYGFNLRYGIKKDLEIYSNTNFFSSNTRSSDTTFLKKSSNGFNNINLGLSYQIKPEDDTPSLLVSTSTSLTERVNFMDNSTKYFSFKNYSISVISYYSTDPIVFLINARYRFSLEKKNKSESITNGNIFTLSPSVIFAANPYTSLGWGIDCQFKNKDRFNNKIVSNSESSIGYRFGVSYELSPKKYLNIDVSKRDTNDYSSNSINLIFSYKL